MCRQNEVEGFQESQGFTSLTFSIIVSVAYFFLVFEDILSNDNVIFIMHEDNRKGPISRLCVENIQCILIGQLYMLAEFPCMFL